MKIMIRKCLIRQEKRTFLLDLFGWAFLGLKRLNWGRTKGWRLGFGFGYADLLWTEGENNPLIEICFFRD